MSLELKIRVNIKITARIEQFWTQYILKPQRGKMEKNCNFEESKKCAAFSKLIGQRWSENVS